MYNKKYRLVEVEEFGRKNPVYNEMLGKVCYLAYFNVGETGWFLYEIDKWRDMPHRVNTSIVEDVDYTLGDTVIVTTKNTRLIFEVIK